MNTLRSRTPGRIAELCGCAQQILLWTLLASPWIASATGTWSQVSRLAPEAINTMLLLSDGTVMAAGANSENGWYRLTPDSTGRYANGAWSTLATMHDTRLYYSSDVLRDGRVFIAGAEYGSGTNTAEVYDPLSNTWTMAPPPPAGQTKFLDSISKVIANGNVLIAPVGPAGYGRTLIYVVASNTWQAGPVLYRGGYQDEASWVKLPDASILTIDPFGQNSERYIPSLNQWINDSIVPVEMYDPYGSELGAAFLLSDGRAFYLGATGNTALYQPSGNTSMGVWQAGPVIPNSQATPDAPAAMMVNGNILCAVSPLPTSSTHFPSPASFYEFDPVANAFTAVNAPTGSTYSGAPYPMRMLDLPDGTVLFSASNSRLYIYQPDGSPLASGQPAISSITQNADGSFHATGTLFNGISEGAAYGDDAQMDSNYPLVRMTNSLSGVVSYARTYNWSSTGVMTGTNQVSTEFALPAGLPSADYSLAVVANGNSSEPVLFSTASLPPVITAQPQNQVVIEGDSATFKIGAAGTPLSYFWQLNGTNIAGATNSAHTISNVQLSDSGEIYSCLVSNLNGVTLGSNAVLTVELGPPPTITSQPSDQKVSVGGTATFSIAGSSTMPISYYWQRGGVFIAGATNSIYSTNNVQLADSGVVFSCLLSNIFGITQSSNAILTVQSPPPNDACSGAIVITDSNFTNAESTTLASSTGDPNPSCIGGFGNGVWYVFTPESGGSLAVDTFGSDFDTGLGLYTGTCGALTQIGCDDDAAGGRTSQIINLVSAGVTYYVLAGGYNAATGNLMFHLNFTPSAPAPNITTQPANQVAQVGSSAIFSVSASGAAPLNYFWMVNGSLLPGANNSTYVATNVQFSESGDLFSCLVSNSFGAVLSSNAVLTVIPASLVQNGGFESGDFSFWATSGNFVSSSVSSNAPYVHSGIYGAQLGPVGTPGFISQTIPTTPGQFYLISTWLLNSSGGAPNEFVIAWNGASLFDVSNVVAAGWTNIQLVASATASATHLQLGFRDDPSYLGLDDISVTAIPAPVFQNVTQSNGIIAFTWSTLAGATYQVQYSTDLTQPSWINLGDAVPATGATLSSSDLIGTDPQRFYRVILAQ